MSYVRSGAKLRPRGPSKRQAVTDANGLPAGSEVFAKGPDPLVNLSVVRGWFEDFNEIIRLNFGRLDTEPGKKQRCCFERHTTAFLPDF